MPSVNYMSPRTLLSLAALPQEPQYEVEVDLQWDLHGAVMAPSHKACGSWCLLDGSCCDNTSDGSARAERREDEEAI